MSFDTPFILTFGTLAASVLALWLPAPALRGKNDWLWAPLLALAASLGVANGFLEWQAPLWLMLFAALAVLARDTRQTWLRIPLLLATCIAPLLFAAHRFPGFHNPVLASGLQFSPGAPPFNMHVNFDMAAVGVILMGVFCPRARTVGDWAGMLRRTWPVTLSTLIAVLGLGLLLGYVRPDLKWTPYSLAFLCGNLLFTCVTEEAFFRGVIFAGLARRMAAWRFGPAAAAIVSALLFGAAHARGGMTLVLLATIAGLHYAAAYARSACIEGAILTHFALNAVHFVCFTYPYLAG